MPTRINQIRRAKLKEEILKGKSYRQALKDAGYSPVTAHCHIGRLPALESVKAEIAQEIDKKGLARKAYITLEHNLKTRRASDRNTAAHTILNFTEGNKSLVDNSFHYHITSLQGEALVREAQRRGIPIPEVLTRRFGDTSQVGKLG